MNASKPEPPPVPQGIVIPDALCTHIERLFPSLPHRRQALVKLVQERDAYGRAKYGQPLMSEDGRNGYEDARQELGDLLQYTYKIYVTDDLKGLEELEELTCGYLQVLRELITHKYADMPALIHVEKPK